jgi:hypothetical protein
LCIRYWTARNEWRATIEGCNLFRIDKDLRRDRKKSISNGIFYSSRRTPIRRRRQHRVNARQNDGKVGQ